ncbi:MAG: C39 family peptidase [Pseudomonadales bacterium]
MSSQRFADAPGAAGYPLPISGPLSWQPGPTGYEARLRLSRVPAGSILVPSFACLDDLGHRWRIETALGDCALAPVPWDCGLDDPQHGSARADAAPAGVLTSQVDCFHVHSELPHAELVLRTTASSRPSHYLAVLSWRARALSEVPVPDGSAALTRNPPARSQMTRQAALAPRICSPTCVAMLHEHYTGRNDHDAIVAECHDPATDLYGVWPLALRAASRRGHLGAVEVFPDWQAPLAALRAGVALVTSIRYAQGELPGAAIAATAGHLVLVHGVTPERIAVNDPAAATDAQVPRGYPAEAFSRAWLRHRGAAYILPP